MSKNFLWTCWSQGFWLQETESCSKVVRVPFVKGIVWIWERLWKEVLLGSGTRKLPGINPCLSFCAFLFFFGRGWGGVGWKLYLPFLIFSLLVGISFCFSMHFVPNDSPITIKFICCHFTKISDTEPSFLNFKKREALSYRLLPSGIKDFKILWMREGFPGGIVLKNPPANAGYARVAGLIPGLEDPLEEKMATYSTIPGKFHG